MSPRRLAAIVLFTAALGVVSCSVVWAQSDVTASLLNRMAGTWKEDASKRANPENTVAPLRFQKSPQGTLNELRGPDADLEVQEVVFDGEPRKTRGGGSTFVWRQVDPNTYERILSRTDGVVTTRRLRLSTDAKTLTEVVERKADEGGTYTIGYQRVSGDEHGLLGTWKPLSVDADAVVLTYEAVGTNALKVSNSAGVNYTVTLDGKPTPFLAPGVPLGVMVAAKAIDEHTIEFTNSRNGIETGKSVLRVSADGKTITGKSIRLGPNASGDHTTQVLVKQ